MKRVTLIAIAISLFGAVAFAGEIDSPLGVVFELDFEQGFRAKTSRGGPNPVNRNLPELAAGISGRGALMAPGRALVYRSSGNLSRVSGAIAMWVQVPFDIASEKARRMTLIAAGGMQLYLGPRGAGRADRGDQVLLRFIPDSRQKSRFFPVNVRRWRTGQWHHLIINWDATMGKMSASLDGTPIPVALTRDSAFQSHPWQPLEHPEFSIGAASADGEDAWLGAVDEVRVFNRPLTEQEARREFLRHGHYRVEVHTLDRFLFSGKSERCRLVFDNRTAGTVRIEPSYEARRAGQRAVITGKLSELAIDAGARATVAVNLRLPAPGDYEMTVRYALHGREEHPSMNLMGLATHERSAPAEDDLRLVAEVDAAAIRGVVESAPSRVVASALGKYREAGSKQHDRFAVPFTVEELGKPHLAVVTYPDDKPRTMEVMLQRLVPPGDARDYQAQTGLFTGDEYPLSNQMLEHKVPFWPTARKMAFIIMTAEDGHPAAVGKLRIYELKGGFSRVAIQPFHGSVPARHIGVYYEDPVLHKNFSAPPLFPGFQKAADTLLDYMDWIGLDTLHYPLVWYRGPLYGADTEFEENMSSRPHPYDYPHYLMKRLETRGMKFNGGMHLHSLASLARYAVADEKRVYAGEETALNMQANNHLMTSGFHRMDPFFNPIDPHVQEAVKRVVAEIAERYGDEPSFTGLTLVLPRHKLFAFGSIQSGYNDMNIRQFEQETGLRLPVDPRDPKRFSKAYQWLMANARAEWIAWRCRKIHDYYKALAGILSAKRSDLKLTVNLFARPELYHERLAHYASSDDILAETLGEAGLDYRLFADDENIVLSWTMVPADYRFYRIKGPDAASAKDHRTAYIAPEITSPLRLLRAGAWAKLHDRYFEDAIGRTDPLPLGVKEIGWRVSTLNANSFHSMEMPVLALNNFDALNITKGGFVIGTYGMEPELRKFAKAFRALPAVPFEDVEGLADPVRVRQKIVDGKAYFYVLNCLPVPADIRLELSPQRAVTDLMTGTPAERGGEFHLKLLPYELRSFRVDAARPVVVGGQTRVSGQFISGLRSRLAALDTGSPSETGAGAYLKLARRCLDEGRYARLYFLLQESWTKQAAGAGAEH